ncbi:MAG: fatty acid--CoA ligase family protein [Candidatus Cloacimonetes bacterium]|nr:fatty acid--CoA ligase family protein [Candidatus Cloacimonadota bacterium]
MNLDFMLERFQSNLDMLAIISEDSSFTYATLLREISKANAHISDNVIPGSIVAIKADFSVESISFMIGLIQRDCILVPISHAVTNIDEFYQIAQIDYEIDLAENTPKILKAKYFDETKHNLLSKIKDTGNPGLILFSSGSTGKSKAALHDLVPMLEKYKLQRDSLRTISFLLFDHIGGFNTLFHVLSNSGTIVIPQVRTPEAICSLIEEHRVELLPTTPSFLNLMIISGVIQKYDLSSLKLITYGTEAMSESVLKRINQALPNVRFKQTYGLSELGIMRSKSKSDDSLWIKVGGEGFETKIIDDILFIKAKSAMLGYLNADSPFDSEGWFNTQDKVEIDGEWIKILGRVTDIINVGGQKVYPAEVEAVLQQMENVADVAVFSKTNPFMGSIVAARVSLIEDESLNDLKRRIREFCKNRLESYKIPAFVEIVDGVGISERFKKVRI